MREEVLETDRSRQTKHMNKEIKKPRKPTNTITTFGDDIGTDEDTVVEGIDEEAPVEFGKFVSLFRVKVQRSLWLRSEKITVGDLMRLLELEQQSMETDRAGTKELRIVWTTNSDQPEQ